MNIPISDLKNELKNNINGCKSEYSYDNKTVTKSILGLFSKLINKFEKTKSYQSGLLIKSLDNWLDRKDENNKPLDSKITDINIGDIYMVDWNLGYSPELSYEHPCVVISKTNEFLFVLPVSGQSQYLEIGYHPVEHDDGNKNYRIVDVSDGFGKKCSIHICQAKTISSTRILYKIGSLQTNSDGICELLIELKQEILNMYFPTEYNKLLEENNNLRKEKETLSKLRKQYQSSTDKAKNENEILKKKIEEMQSIIDNYKS